MYVYFVKAGDAIKVGIATDIKGRLISIQVGNPYKVGLIHYIETTEENARNIESEIQNIFHKTNLNGEWFQANQFMEEFIKNIKEHGWESHSDWIEKQYKKDYGEILISLKERIEKGLIGGNVVCLEKLKKDLGKLVNDIYVIPSLPVNMSEAVRNWIEKRNDSFVPRDIYSEFGISTKNGKHNVIIALKRLTENGTIERSGEHPKCIYKKLGHQTSQK